MNLLNILIVIIGYFLTLCQTQIYNYSAQRRVGYGYRPPSSSSSSASTYYNQPKSNYQSSAVKTSSYYNSFSNPSYTNSYYKQFSSRNSYPYSTQSAQSYSSYKQPTTTRKTTSRQSLSNSQKNYRNSLSSSTTKGSYSSASDSSYNSKQYLSNSYSSENYKKENTLNNKDSYRISKADAENAKFVGAANQEDEEDSRSFHLKRRKFHRRFGGALANPCLPFGKDTGKSVIPPSKEQGRILWDTNIYNIYPQSLASLGCGGYGGLAGGLGYGDTLSDPIAPAYNSPGAGISNFLSLFAPGILQNSLAVTTRPQQYADYGQTPNDNNDLQNDPNVDPNYNPLPPAPLPVRRPNRVYYDSAGAPSVTPAQLLGGIATTVNGIIQQFTGNVQPAYG